MTMKITDVKLRFAKHYLFVQIYTDAGITGLGEAGNWGYLQATAAAIEKFADYLIEKIRSALKILIRISCVPCISAVLSL